MKNQVIGVLFWILVSGAVQAQMGQFIGYSAHANIHVIKMKVERAATNTPIKVFVGGGAAMSMSIKEGLNFRAGVDFLHYKPGNTRGYYDVCESEGIDYSCLPQINVTQFYFPVGAEFYLNTNYKPYHTFFVFNLIPSLSIMEKNDMVVYDEVLIPVNEYTEKSNGPKFQDLNASIGFGNEISLPGNLKFFIEPSAQMSLLFRKQNFVNPITSISIKVGLRYRTEKKK